MNPQVTLVSYTSNPIETVYHVWEASKTDGPVPSVTDIVANTDLVQKAKDLFWKIIRQRIPVGEHISFIFMLENVSISWREQAVRHRIGIKVGDRLGLDIVPDLAESSFWSQSMRIQNMSEFAKRDLYRVPETLKGKECPEWTEPVQRLNVPNSIARTFKQAPAEEIFREAMDYAQLAYQRLLSAGVPMEDAREVIPLGAQHRISWALNLQTILHVLGKRGCWILQLGLWGPIISGMINALAEKVDPVFRTLLAPPCINTEDKFDACLYPVENQRRLDGRDDHPVCPLFVCRDSAAEKMLAKTESDQEFYMMPLQRRPSNLVQLRLRRFGELQERAEEYRKLWLHDPYLWDIKAT